MSQKTCQCLWGLGYRLTHLSNKRTNSNCQFVGRNEIGSQYLEHNPRYVSTWRGLRTELECPPQRTSLL